MVELELLAFALGGGIIMMSAEIGSGFMSGTYNKETRLYSASKINWSQLIFDAKHSALLGALAGAFAHILLTWIKHLLTVL